MRSALPYSSNKTDAKAWQTLDINNTNDPQKKYRLGNASKIFYLGAYTSFTAPTSHLVQMWIKTHRCFHLHWPQLLSVLGWWFCCWWLIVCCFSHGVWSLFYSILLIVLSSLLHSCWGTESWLLYFNYVVMRLSVFFVSSPLVSWISLWSMHGISWPYSSVLGACI